jgi:SAM-dependent methyltransferase
MSEKPWYETFFGEDYLEIYQNLTPPDRTVAEVDGIVSLLRLEAGARILDLACGYGRHSILLSKRGFEVTGYDLSPVFLGRARAEAGAQRANIRWIQGDMRALPFDAEFDAVINIFTAFGYFEDPEDDLKTLRGIRRALRPGGQFLLEIVHRDALLARFQPQSFEQSSNGTIILRERAWDLVRDMVEDNVTLIRPDGTRTQYRITHRMYSLHDFLALVQRSGLEAERWYGGLDGSPLQLNSDRLVVISRRPP